jgi:hypothetical protein
MSNKTPEKYKLFGMIVPAGTDEDGNLLVSVCYNINKYSNNLITSTPDGNRLDENSIRDNYKSFVNSLVKLQESKESEIPILLNKTQNISGTKSKNPFEYCFANEFEKHKDYNSIKKDLWNQIFFSNEKFEVEASKSFHHGSEIKFYNHSKPDFIYDINNEKSHENKLLNSFSPISKIETITNLINISESESKPLINERLNLFHEFGVANEKIAKSEKKAFAMRYNDVVQAFIDDTNNVATVKELKDFYPNRLITKAYVEKSDKIEIDEIVHSYSNISNDPIIARLMGIIVDYKILKKDLPQEEYFYLTINETDDTYFLNTPIRRFRDSSSSSKYVYIIENKNNKSQYFDRTILKSEHTNILTFDMLSHLQNLEYLRMKCLKGENNDNSETKEVLTRGLLFTHDKLDELIAPVDIVVKNKDGNPIKFIDEDGYSEEHFVKGIRVAVNYKNNLYPLTCRSVKLLDSKGNKIYYNGNIESCLHIDASTAYMQDGEVKSSTTNVVFEYSGELLKLKSAFAKANTQNKFQYAANTVDNNHDDGLFKSEERFKKILTYYPFPIIDRDENDSALFNCFYSIPDKLIKQKDAPQLRFNNEYSFIINQEYLNGYGLPLRNEKDLSIEKIIKGEASLKPVVRMFYLAENKKSVTLYHRREVKDDLSEPLTEKPSLEHLVVRSDNVEDSNQYIDERHVLPPKIDIETAFWWGLLSKLGEDDSFDYKTRANCPFVDEAAYDKFINEKDSKGSPKGNKCAECGKLYCGGTQMRNFYSDTHIYPNHYFTDPSIKGFTIRFFWNKECSDDKEIQLNEIGTVKFGGGSGFEPKSYLLRMKGASEEAFVENHDWREILEVYLKKGMMIYAQLTNEIDDEKYFGEKHLVEGGWWNQILEMKNKLEHQYLIEPKTKEHKAARQKLVDERNKPKVISLTHAVKEPLITPEIIKLSSTPKDHKFIEHINDWLKEKDFQRYKVGVNVIALRSNKLEIKDVISLSGVSPKDISVFGFSNIIISVTNLGDASNEVVIEGTINGTDWSELQCQNISTNTYIKPISSIGSYSIVIFKNIKSVRVRVSKHVKGTIEGMLYASDYNLSINSSISRLELNSHFERLDAIRKIEFLKDMIPTGALELWMRKEEFIDNPEQIVLASNSATNHLPNEPVVSFLNNKNVFTLDCKIEFSNEVMNQLKNLKNIEDIDSIADVFRSLITKLKLEYDFKTTKFEEREYYLKDISKFKGFFTDEKFIDNGDVKAIDKLEEFALPKIKDVMSDLDEDSKFRFKVIVLNNSQPSKPDVAFAVTTIQETRSTPLSQKTISIQKGNIVTIYLKRGRLKSGKDERVGVIVDADSLYNKLFKDNELISKAGRDIVSDRYSNRSQYLQYGDIIIPEINEYEVGFDNELGIYHFLPKFDVEKQLWKFEAELDIKTMDGKQLHNPFINFSIVHFQPFSINYNDKTADASLLELKNDCRISDVENSTWCYLLPERKLSIYFDKPGWFDAYGEVDLTVSFDHESLHHFNFGENKWKVRSNFIVTVQGSETGQSWDWHSVGSWLDDGKLEVDNATLSFHHPLLLKDVLDNEENLAKLKLKFKKYAIPNDTEHSNKYSYFRVRFIEVEWFANEIWSEVIKRTQNENPDLFNSDVIDNEEMRIRYVELIY